MRKIILFFLNIYIIYISPVLPPRCRFYPSCSRFSYTAFEQCGFFKGLYLSCRRIIRCHPFHPGGYDPVSDAEVRKELSSYQEAGWKMR